MSESLAARKGEAFRSGGYDLKIGTHGGMHWMNGSINEVKLWDRPLAADGKSPAKYNLPVLPILDGMAAANGWPY